MPILATLGVAVLVSATAAPAAPARGPVVVIGVDGMTFDVLDPLIEAGKVPELARLVRGGARAVLRSEQPMRSPALWTTIATGQPRRVHGIYDFVTGSGYWPARERSSERKLVTSGMRRARAIWQYVGDAGKRVAVVNWLNTWPAEPVNGVMVAPYVALDSGRQSSIKGRIYTGVRRQVWPADSTGTVMALVQQPADVPAASVAALLDQPPGASPLYAKVPHLRRYMFSVRWSLASLLTTTAIDERLLRDGDDTRPALLMTYFDGADTLGHRFWVFRESDRRVRERLRAVGIDAGLAPELERRFGHVIESYYAQLDAVVHRITAAAGPGATVVLVSDHGWGSAPRGRKPSPAVPFEGEHRMDGVFVAHGPGIRPGRHPALSLYDVAPTVLFLANVAVPDELPGHVAEPVVDRSAFGPPAPLPVAYRDRRTGRSQPAPVEAPHEEQEIERLRSLGYVQ